MAHAPETRAAVRQSYIYDRLGLEAAAERHGVPLGTARRWKAQADGTGDDWDKARSVNAMTAAGAGAIAQIVLNDFMTLHQATVQALNEDGKTPPLARAEAMSRLADAFTKTMAAVAKAAPDLGRYAVAGELLQDLAAFVRDRYPEHGQALAEILEPFAAHVAEKYG